MASEALFPIDPTAGKIKIPGANQGDFYDLHTYTSETDAGEFSVNVCDYGDNSTNPDPDSVLERAKEGSLHNGGSHLISEEKITLGPVHGIAFESANDTMHFSIHLYLSGSVVYFPGGSPGR